jgi:hypothetical protein
MSGARLDEDECRWRSALSKRRPGPSGQSTIDNPLTAPPPPQRRLPSRRAALLGLAAAAVAAGIAIALLTGNGGGGGRFESGHRTLVQVASGYLGMPSSEIRRRLRAGASLEEIADGTKGRSRTGLLEALYDARAREIRDRHLPPADERTALRAARAVLAAQVGRARSTSGIVRIAASYLGLQRAVLAKELAHGRTLAAIANATPGRSSDGLVEAIVRVRRRAIDRALAGHAISAAQARRSLSRLRTRAERQTSRALG